MLDPSNQKLSKLKQKSIDLNTKDGATVAAARARMSPNSSVPPTPKLDGDEGENYKTGDGHAGVINQDRLAAHKKMTGYVDNTTTKTKTKGKTGPMGGIGTRG